MLSENINYIKGYYPYVKELKENVFKFKAQDKYAAAKVFEKMHPHNHTMVSIHIRMTDYKEHVEKLYNITSYPVGDYLTRAMDYFATKYNVSRKCSTWRYNLLFVSRRI